MSMPDKRHADSNNKSESLPQDNNRVQESGASHLRKKTSAMTHNKIVVRRRMKAAKGPHWKILQDPPKLHAGEKGKHVKTKSEKSHSKTGDETEASSAAVVGGVLAGVLAIPFVVTVIALIW